MATEKNLEDKQTEIALSVFGLGICALGGAHIIKELIEEV